MYTRCSAMQAAGMCFCGGLWSRAAELNAASSTEIHQLPYISLVKTNTNSR